MKEYLVITNGSGEGCDYTIGCNISYCFLEAENMNDAISKAMGKHPLDMLDEEVDDEDFACNLDCIARWTDYQTHEEGSLEDISIYEISNNEDLDQMCLSYQKGLKVRRDRNSKKSQEKLERAEYERLKKKFES